MPTLIARFIGPDLQEWQCHYFGRDSIHYHVMLIPADAAIARPGWWWSEEDPRTRGADYWPGRVGAQLDLRADEDAFIDSLGRAVWAQRIRHNNTGPYLCNVIGVVNPRWALVDLGEVVVPITRAMIKTAWHNADV